MTRLWLAMVLLAACGDSQVAPDSGDVIRGMEGDAAPLSGSLDYEATCSGTNTCIAADYQMSATPMSSGYTVDCSISHGPASYVVQFVIQQTTTLGTTVGATGCAEVPGGGGRVTGGSVSFNFADGSEFATPAALTGDAGSGCELTVVTIGLTGFTGTLRCSEIPDNLMPPKMRDITGSGDAGAANIAFVSCAPSTIAACP